jgi:hypothetical protein
MQLNAAISEVFLQPGNVTQNGDVFTVVGGGIRFDCYPEIGDLFCHDRKPRICPGKPLCYFIN